MQGTGIHVPKHAKVHALSVFFTRYQFSSMFRPTTRTIIRSLRSCYRNAIKWSVVWLNSLAHVKLNFRKCNCPVLQVQEAVYWMFELKLCFPSSTNLILLNHVKEIQWVWFLKVCNLYSEWSLWLIICPEHQCYGMLYRTTDFDGCSWSRRSRRHGCDDYPVMRIHVLFFFKKKFYLYYYY